MKSGIAKERNCQAKAILIVCPSIQDSIIPTEEQIDMHSTDSKPSINETSLLPSSSTRGRNETWPCILKPSRGTKRTAHAAAVFLGGVAGQSSVTFSGAAGQNKIQGLDAKRHRSIQASHTTVTKQEQTDETNKNKET